MREPFRALDERFVAAAKPIGALAVDPNLDFRRFV
jgi:hypothetical protein